MLEKLTMEKLYWDCESNLVSSLKEFTRKFNTQQSEYSSHRFKTRKN